MDDRTAPSTGHRTAAARPETPSGARPATAVAPPPRPPSLPEELRSSALLFGLALLVTGGAATAAQAALRVVG